MTTHSPRIVDLSETQPNTRRGGDLRAMLTPTAVGATSGFMGLAIVKPGERIGEHYHPYSEEFVYVVSGLLEVDLDGETHSMRPDQGLMIPLNVRHRFRNVGDVEARMVFHLGPLAPRPELGHVDTEHTESAEQGRPPERTGAVSYSTFPGDNPRTPGRESREAGLSGTSARGESR